MHDKRNNIEDLVCKLQQKGIYIICALPFEANDTNNIFYSGLGKRLGKFE